MSFLRYRLQNGGCMGCIYTQMCKVEGREGKVSVLQGWVSLWAGFE